MLKNGKPTRVEWMCTQCGRKIQTGASLGRPMPGTCPRSPRKGPHHWVKNKEF